MQKLEDAPSMEIQNLWRSADELRPFEPDEETLCAWMEGRTGFPFLDACLRAVRATGWMNFRMRSMMVSFSSYDLWQHWREPSLHLARCFTDYEPGIHYPQVQMQSGTTGINTLRMYDPVKQGLDHDPRGEFIRRWVPELCNVPAPWIHHPWNLTPLELAECKLRPGRDYPERIVEHRAAISAARAAFSILRVRPESRMEAGEIQNRHGARKSGLAQVVRKQPRRTRKAKSLPPDADQLKLL
jgi:deoxyribodipyrimidine photo-lyase